MLNPIQIPYLFPGSGFDAKGPNIFSLVINSANRNGQVIGGFINLMTQVDTYGLLYQTIVDQFLDVLLEQRIDLKSYFTSPMSLHKISSSNYPRFHEDDSVHIVPSNLESINLISQNYQDVMRIYLKKESVMERLRSYFDQSFKKQKVSPVEIQRSQTKNLSKILSFGEN